MTFEEYKSLKALNQSGMKLLLESPRKYWDERVNPNPPKIKKQPAQQRKLDLGTALHSLILMGIEPYVQPPTIKPNTDKGKDEIKAIKKTLPEGQLMFEKKYCDVVYEMADSIYEDEAAMNILLRAGTGRHLVEQNLAFDYQFGPLPTDTIRCKAKLDIIKQYRNKVHLCDLKTSGTVSPDGFARNAFNMGYHVQAAFYMHAAASVLQLDVGQVDQEFSIIAVQSARPYLCKVYSYGAKDVRQGQRAVDEAVRLYLKYRHMEDRWPSFDVEDETKRGKPELLEIPVWGRDEQYHEEPQLADPTEDVNLEVENPY